MMTKRYVTCPKCGSQMVIQREWEDDMTGPQGEITRSEKWSCGDCDHIFFIAAHYRMDFYNVGTCVDGDVSCGVISETPAVRVTGY